MVNDNAKDKPGNISINQKIEEFSKLLDKLSLLSDKKKSLWKEIYANALQDRDNASNMYASVSAVVVGAPNDHAIHGPNIAKYIERMSKANDQLIKLAELIGIAEETDTANLTPDTSTAMTVDEIYKTLRDTDTVASVPANVVKKKR